MSFRYKNRTIINQRGGSIDINNSTDQEKIQISHRSGSNINLTNFTTSELASNNKQVLIINDEFKTVGNNSNSFISKNKTNRVGENTYSLKGFITEDEIKAFNDWKSTFQTVALDNSLFKIKRGGYGYVNGSQTDQSGSREDNPVLKTKVTVVENEFQNYSKIPIIDSNQDEVADYVPVSPKETDAATEKEIDENDIEKASGSSGSSADGVIKYGASKSASTENGSWDENDIVKEIPNKIVSLQDDLITIEKRMGNGGDDISFTKRNKLETIGASFNDYPSIKIDPEGRLQPHEVVVGEQGAFQNYDFSPMVEEIDNSSSFPGGENTLIIGNKYNLNIGSGGYNLKTTGNVEIGGASYKAGFQKYNLSSTQGMHFMSDNVIEISSEKSINLRTNRQVLVEGSLGVKKNIVASGGFYAEGELYVHHITAPVEIQQTEDTILAGKFNTTESRTLPIGEALVNGEWVIVYALPTDNLIVNYPHSHHFKNIPIRLCKSNRDVRKAAQNENINNHSKYSVAINQMHERKQPFEA